MRMYVRAGLKSQDRTGQGRQLTQWLCVHVRLCVHSYGDPHFVFSVPAGEEWRGRPAPRATLRVFNMDFFRKIVLRHDTGLGEAYMEEVCVTHTQDMHDTHTHMHDTHTHTHTCEDSFKT